MGSMCERFGQFDQRKECVVCFLNFEKTFLKISLWRLSYKSCFIILKLDRNRDNDDLLIPGEKRWRMMKE